MQQKGWSGLNKMEIVKDAINILIEYGYTTEIIKSIIMNKQLVKKEMAIIK